MTLAVHWVGTVGYWERMGEMAALQRFRGNTYARRSRRFRRARRRALADLEQRRATLIAMGYEHWRSAGGILR